MRLRGKCLLALVVLAASAVNLVDGQCAPPEGAQGEPTGLRATRPLTFPVPVKADVHGPLPVVTTDLTSLHRCICPPLPTDPTPFPVCATDQGCRFEHCGFQSGFCGGMTCSGCHDGYEAYACGSGGSYCVCTLTGPPTTPPAPTTVPTSSAPTTSPSLCRRFVLGAIALNAASLGPATL